MSILLFLTILQTTPDQPRTGDYVTMAALVLADSWTTYEALQQGGTEINPLYNIDKDTEFGEILAYNMGLTVLTHYGIKHVTKRFSVKINPVEAQIYGRVVVVSWNLTQINIRW